MARRLRTTSLSLKLDVIIEEGFPGPVDALLSPPCPIQYPIRTQNAASCTLTLQNDEDALGSEPLFLHTGKWPCMDMVDDILLESTSLSTEASTTTDTDMVTESSENNDLTKALSNETDSNGWKPVTADQLSMVMDHWKPNEESDPFSAETAASIGASITSKSEDRYTMTAAQQSLFLREVMDEYLTRAEMVEHIQEFEDNDDAMEIVATLEGYRQIGWAREMIAAFPRECWFFWSSSGMDSKGFFDHGGVCDGHGIPILDD